MRELSLRDEYRTEITGLGEIYEVLSCRLLIQHLRATLPGEYVITFLPRKEIQSKLLRLILDRSAVVASGFADIPPWPSGYRPFTQGARISPLLRFASFAKPIFTFLVSLERRYPYAIKARKAHILWFVYSTSPAGKNSKTRH